MRLKIKVILFAVVPLALSLAVIATAVFRQQSLLAERERALVEASILDAKHAELRHYVELALSTVAPWYREGHDDDTGRRAALARLSRLDYGQDGYFFVYDLDGRNLMHPRQPELTGHSQWELRDPRGEPTVQRLIETARNGGGYVEYLWERPSTGVVERKLGYVVSLPRWNWMIGTGIYLDDVTTTLADLDRQSAANIRDTMAWIAACAVVGVLAIGGCGLALNLSEQRIANQKLRRLALQALQSQEEERARLARELHDGSSREFESIRAAIERAAGDDDFAAARRQIDAALTRFRGAEDKLREISHRLRPLMLDELGLPASLMRIAADFSSDTGIHTEVQLPEHARDLPEHVVTVLFRVAQEALTNIARHSQATRAWITLAQNEGDITLSMRDNGVGFRPATERKAGEPGIGLRTMRERLDSIGGTMSLHSSATGTQIEARVPRAAALPRQHDPDSNPGWMTPGCLPRVAGDPGRDSASQARALAPDFGLPREVIADASPSCESSCDTSNKIQT
ncbi:cache domain-containing protein [Derxia gummosa]|uniref:Cache domain-containing protein n=1 Tax=Derxia gummosa DSM 723 TaxID=1121388 RepID=A0A8B6XBH9_9BURK|nr:cache domain-containing protein [Derxia gummosa]